MTTTKDKLSASVRQAKATQASRAEDASRTESAKAGDPAVAEPQKTAPTGKKPSGQPRSGTRKSSATPRKPGSTTARRDKPASANEVPESGTALFPDRVWPD